MTPKISIIMPALNVADYIKKCMDSVVNQTYCNLEILVIDAGSTDGTLDILKEYAERDHRIQIIHSDKKSYGYQMNYGLNMASGDYIGIVETDDYIAKNMIETLLETAIKSGADFVKGCASFFTENNGIESQGIIINDYMIKQGYADKIVNPSVMPELLVKDIYHWLGIYKKHFLEEIRFNETPGAAFQDQGFLLQTLSKAKIAVYIDKVVYFYRQSNTGSSIYSAKGFAHIYHEYQLNYPYIKKLDSGWEQAFFQRMLDQVIGRYTMMVKSGYFWSDVRQDIEKLRSWLLYAQKIGLLQKKYMNYIKGMRFQAFIESDETLFDYMKNPALYERAINIEKATRCKVAWIYGAGKIGSVVAKELCQECFKNKVQGIVVSEAGETKSLEGYEVKTLDEIEAAAKDTLFILAVSWRFQERIIWMLEEKGFTNYVVWDDNFKTVKQYLQS